MGGAVFPAYIWPQVGIMAVLQKDLCQDCCIQCPDPKASHCWATPLLETPGPSQTRLAQSLVMSLLLFPEFWWTQGFVCALQESVSPVVRKFCNHIPLAFKVKFPGGSQSLCGIPRLGNLLWALELVQQCENFLVQLLSSLWAVCSVTLWWGLHAAAPNLAAARIPAPMACHCWPVPLQETLHYSKAGLAQSLVESLVSGAHMVLSEPSECLWRVQGFILNVILPLQPSCWGFSFSLGCGEYFFGGIHHSPVNGCLVVSCNFLEFSQEKVSACPSTLPSWEVMNKCFLRAIEFTQCIELGIKFNRLVNSFDPRQ